MTAVLTVPSPPPFGLRAANTQDLLNALTMQQELKTDVVVAARKLRASGGQLIVPGAVPVITASGVTPTAGTFDLSSTALGGLAGRLGLHAGDLRRFHRRRPQLFDDVVDFGLTDLGPDAKLLVRAFNGPAGSVGYARAVLSANFKTIDHLPIVYGVLDGIRASGMNVTISTDLTDRRLYMRITSAEIGTIAKRLLARYRNPWTGATGAEDPWVWAGFTVSNSETGEGRMSMVPEVQVNVCRNSLVALEDAHTRIHLGAELEEGLIRWSDRTRQLAQDLIASKVCDFATEFLNIDYITAKIDTWGRLAARPVHDVESTIARVCQGLKYTRFQREVIQQHFLRSGDITAGGIMHAVTSAAQEQRDADESHRMSSHASRALTLAAAR